MVPPDAPVTGTIVYTAADLRLLRSQFGQTTPIELWQSTLAAAGLGALIGYGMSALTPWFHQAGPWFALTFAIAATTGWSWRLSKAVAPAEPTRPQSVTLDASGLRLTTDRADTLMRWPHFTRRFASAGHIALKTEDNTWVLLRPGYFLSQEDYAAAVALIEANVA